MLLVIVIAALFHATTVLAQTDAADLPRFKFVLPEDFQGWACVDFGVEGAPPLRREQDMYVIEPSTNTILRTSSLPGLANLSLPAEVIQVVNGAPRRREVDEIQQRGEYDTKNPIARYCLFFGSAAAAAGFQRPPTLAESRLGTKPVLQHFEFSLGELCDFRDVSRLCLVARDVSGRRIATSILRAIGDQVTAVTDKCDTFDGIVVRYEADWAAYTHSSSRGPRSAFAELRRDDPGKGTRALVTWFGGQGGSADAVAELFGRELAAFLRQAASTACTK